MKDSDEFECAEGGRRSRTFPQEWGMPPGERFSEERARWVRDRVARTCGRRALDKLVAADKRHQQMLQRLALMARREGP